MVWKAVGRLGIHAVAGLLAAALTALAAGASGFELSMNNGRVTIRAQDALITDILAEWGRVGNTAIIDADELVDHTVTIELVDVPEAKALRTLLRTASGYLAAPRAAMSDGVSRFDRILILATSKTAARVTTVASPGRVASTPRASGASLQRRGVVPSAPRGRAPFTVSPAEQEQLDQLQRLLQQPDAAGADPPQPVAVPPVVGTVPAARPGMPMGTTDLRQGTVSVPTGAFGAVDGPTGAFGSTPVPETSGRSETTIPSPRP
jgi:hypothetical protein